MKVSERVRKRERNKIEGGRKREREKKKREA